MNKTFKIVDAYLGNKNIKVYEDGERVLELILNDYNVDGAIKVLEALGYQMIYRAY